MIKEPFLKKGSSIHLTGTLAVMAGVLMLVSGCAMPSAMSSSVKYEGPIGEKKVVKVLQVSKVEEGREDGGRSRIGIGFIAIIPLVPYGSQRFTPERCYKNAAMMNYDFKDDLAQTVVKDLTAAGIAQSVSYDAFGRKTEADDGVYRLDLILKEGVWHRNFTAYGCSFMGVYLWAVGLPVSYGHSAMTFEAVLHAPSGVELGRKTFDTQMSLTEIAYVPNKFPRQLPLLYQQISPGLRAFVCDCLKK